MLIKIAKVQEQVIELVDTNEPEGINKYRREASDKWYRFLGLDWVKVWNCELLEEVYQVWMKEQKSQNVAVSIKKA